MNWQYLLSGIFGLSIGVILTQLYFGNFPTTINVSIIFVVVALIAVWMKLIIM